MKMEGIINKPTGKVKVVSIRPECEEDESFLRVICDAFTNSRDEGFSMSCGTHNSEDIHIWSFDPSEPTADNEKEFGQSENIVCELEREGRVLVVESMLADGKSWDEIGFAINFHPKKAERDYDIWKQTQTYM